MNSKGGKRNEDRRNEDRKNEKLIQKLGQDTENKKFIRWCILGAIGGILMATGDWLLGCIPLQETDTGIFTIVVALAIHTWSATLAWLTTYLGPRIGTEAAVTAVTAYQDDMLIAILPMYLPMVLVIGIHFVMLLTGKTRYPKWMLIFHPVTVNILLVVIPDIAQAMQVPVATWMSVMSQSSTNSSIVIWCIVAAIYMKRRSAKQLCN